MPLSGPTPSSEPETQPDSQLIASIATIAELLQDVTLTIPSYQRPYRWDVENVSQLIADIQRFRPSGHYRLGTVILYTGDGDDGTETRRSEIVDGQQRYLTFAVIAHAITEVPRLADVKLAERLRNAVQHIQLPGRRDGQTQLNLRRNFAQVRNVVTRWSGIEIEEFARFFLDDCSVIVLKVADLDAAFQMFDSQAAEVADGLLVMPFGTTRFLHEHTMPRVRAGLAAAGRSEEEFEVVPEVIVSVTDGQNDDDHTSTRRLLAFYGSTPAYRPVLDAHGWGDLQPELNAMSKQGRWQEMTSLISDEILHTIAACGSPAEVAAHVRDRVNGVGDRVCLYQTGPIATDALAPIVDELAGRP